MKMRASLVLCALLAAVTASAQNGIWLCGNDYTNREPDPSVNCTQLRCPGWQLAEEEKRVRPSAQAVERF